jgi:hypothetical protein
MAIRLRSLALILPIGTCLAGMASCSAPSKGSLVLAITTDMVTPKDINVVSVYVSSNSAVKFDYLGRVLPDGTVALPATLAVIEPDDPTEQIHIRVIAFQEQKARVVRDVVTTVPQGRTSLLRLPLNLLDDGSGTGQLPAMYLPAGPNNPSGAPEGNTSFIPTDPTVITTTCQFLEKGETMINGECKPAGVESSKLTDYQETAVYGAGGMMANGAPATCFDVASCFSGATLIPASSISMTGCSFPLPQGADPAKLNLALATTDGTGECTASGQCFVPLENDLNEGWSVSNGTVNMITGICMKMLGSGAQLYQVQGTCDAKTTSNPVCEPTTVAEVRALLDGGAPQDAAVGLDASPDGSAKDGGVTLPDSGTDAGARDSGVCAQGQIYCNGACVTGSQCLPATDAGTDGTAGDASLGCKTAADCASTTGPYCNTANGACVQCLTDTNCASGLTCNAVTFTCSAASDGGSVDGSSDASASDSGVAPDGGATDAATGG